MYGPLDIVNNERGSLLVIAIVVLLLLTLLGSSITTTTSIELQIAGNDKLHKTAFYEADGALDIGAEILEQNLGCVGAPGGFSQDVLGDNQPNETADSSDDDRHILIVNQTMWTETSATEADPTTSPPNRDIMWPAKAELLPTYVPQTNITMGGNTVLSTGAAIQMVAGYEGKGKGAGGGGGYIAYDMFSNHRGVNNSQSSIQIQWRHVIGQEGSCNY